jgi:hypothetical protein
MDTRGHLIVPGTSRDLPRASMAVWRCSSGACRRRYRENLGLWVPQIRLHTPNTMRRKTIRRQARVESQTLSTSSCALFEFPSGETQDFATAAKPRPCARTVLKTSTKGVSVGSFYQDHRWQQRQRHQQTTVTLGDTSSLHIPDTNYACYSDQQCSPPVPTVISFSTFQ